MTKKVFDAVAASLAKSWDRRTKAEYDGPGEQDAYNAGFRAAVLAVVIAFEDGNPRFDRAKFAKVVFGADAG